MMGRRGNVGGFHDDGAGLVARLLPGLVADEFHGGPAELKRSAEERGVAVGAGPTTILSPLSAPVRRGRIVLKAAAAVLPAAWFIALGGHTTWRRADRRRGRRLVRTGDER